MPARQQHQLESLVSQATGEPIPRTTLTDPGGYGLGIYQLTLGQTGTVWYYEGQAVGARVLYFYFPAPASSSRSPPTVSADNDDLLATAISAYQTLQKAGAVHPG